MPVKRLPKVCLVKDGKLAEVPADTIPPPAQAKPWFTRDGVVDTIQFGAICGAAGIITNPWLYIGFAAAVMISSYAVLAVWDYFKEKKHV